MSQEVFVAELPELSPLELDCLRRLWARGEASVRDIRDELPDAPSYSTVRKIVERLEHKGAVERVRVDGKAWVYRARIAAPALIRREVGRFVNALFDGRGEPLVSHLVDLDAVTLEDLRELERRLQEKEARR